MLGTRPQGTTPWSRHATGGDTFGPMAPRPPKCAEIQAWVLKWLSTDLDPQDFPLYLIAAWAEENEIDGVPENAYVDDLAPVQQADYKAWLEGEVWRLMATDPLELPAYLTLHAERKAPPGTWFAHFTCEPGGFHAFDRGTTMDGLHLSTWKRRKDPANCKRNLPDAIGIAEVVFGFAFDAATAARNQRGYGHKYGDHVVLFQCDCAVIAYHDGDEETQAIFPICAEYNVVPFTATGGGGLLAETERGEDIEFDSLKDALDYVQHAERRAAGLGQWGGWPRLRRLRRLVRR